MQVRPRKDSPNLVDFRNLRKGARFPIRIVCSRSGSGEKGILSSVANLYRASVIEGTNLGYSGGYCSFRVVIRRILVEVLFTDILPSQYEEPEHSPPSFDDLASLKEISLLT
jgi:hypothetical protein